MEFLELIIDLKVDNLEDILIEIQDSILKSLVDFPSAGNLIVVLC